MGYSMIHVDKVEPSGPAGAVRFVRRVLGVEAFGINWFEIPANTEGREHDELETGQEEVNVIVAGSGRYRIDGEEIGPSVSFRQPAQRDGGHYLTAPAVMPWISFSEKNA